MKYYQELTLIPDAEISLNFLWSKVYPQIHLALVETKTPENHSKMGVTFPKYQNTPERKTLGNKLRIFSPDTNNLQNLNLTKWLHTLDDYVHLTSIKEVPDNIKTHASFYRIQKRKTNAQKAYNTAQRLGIPYEKALAHLQGRDETQPQAPFIHMKSLSSKHSYRLMIGKKITNLNDPQSKEFNTYGLSSKASLPLF